MSIRKLKKYQQNKLGRRDTKSFRAPSKWQHDPFTGETFYSRSVKCSVSSWNAAWR